MVVTRDRARHGTMIRLLDVIRSPRFPATAPGHGSNPEECEFTTGDAVVRFAGAVAVVYEGAREAVVTFSRTPAVADSLEDAGEGSVWRSRLWRGSVIYRRSVGRVQIRRAEAAEKAKQWMFIVPARIQERGPDSPFRLEMSSEQPCSRRQGISRRSARFAQMRETKIRPRAFSPLASGDE